MNKEEKTLFSQKKKNKPCTDTTGILNQMLKSSY